MSERRRIIIKKRPAEAIEPSPHPPRMEGEGGLGHLTQQDLPQTEEGIEQQVIDVEAAHKRYKDFMAKLNSIRDRDKTMQRVFHRGDFELRVVKKKLEDLNAARRELLVEAGPIEDVLSEAIDHLEDRIASLEEELFEKLVELESIRSDEERGRSIDRELAEKLEQETYDIREEIAKVRQKINELQACLDEIKALPQRINELTTTHELADELLQQLVNKFKDEAKISSTIEKIMQEETVPREYAVIYLWKKVFRPKVASQ